MKKIIENKFFKGFLFVSSAILLALLLSFFIKNNGIKYETNGSTIIENQKDSLIIGNKTFDELAEGITNSKPVTTPNSDTQTNDDGNKSYGNINTVTPILKDSQTSTKVEKPKKEPTQEKNKPIEITQEALDNIAQTGISETDLYFLRDIVFITDEIVADYTETLSYALDGNFAKGELNIENLRKDLEKLNKLEVEDKSLKEIKTSLINGTTKYIEGFEDYFSYGDSSTKLFQKADEHFYNAQSTLQIFLETYH